MKKILLISVLLSLIIYSGGCWDRREPEGLAIVIGAGFDYDEENDMFKVILQVVNPLVTDDPEGGEVEGKPAFWTISAWGHTTLDALSNIRKKLSREIDISHVQILLIAEDMLKERGILPVIDPLERTRGTRPIVLPIIARGDPEEMLSQSFPTEMINVKGIREIVRITSQEIGGVTSENARVFIKKLGTPGIEPVAVILQETNEEEEENDNEDDPSGSNSENETGSPEEDPPFLLEGIGVFRKDILVDVFNQRETRGWNWIQGSILRAVLNIKFPAEGEEEEPPASIIVHQKEARIIPEINKGQPEIKVEIGADARLEGVMSPPGLKALDEVLEKIEKRITEVIRNDVEASLDKAQSLQSDVFGFGNAFYRLHYSYWKDIEKDWPEYFSQLSVDFDIQINLRRTGMIYRSIKPR